MDKDKNSLMPQYLLPEHQETIHPCFRQNKEFTTEDTEYREYREYRGFCVDFSVLSVSSATAPALL
jgi:hypothetical protein